MRYVLLSCLFGCVVLVGPDSSCGGCPAEREISTFSIVAYDSVAEEWGIGVQSKFLAVGSVVPWAKAEVGAIATQAMGNTTYGPRGLDLLEGGMEAAEVVRTLTSEDPDRERRQLGVVDFNGGAASWTGGECFEWAGHVVGKAFCAQGNILTGQGVVDAMAGAFRSTEGSLGRRLIAALRAGQEAGGDSRGKQSAALLVVKEAGGYLGYDDRFIDLRVDDHENPIEELSRIYDLHEQVFQGWAYARLAARALEKKRGEEATSNLDRAIAIAEKYSGNADLLNAIAWELAIHGFRLDEALELATKAVELAPEDGNIWDTLGETYARRGQYAEAVEAEEKAVALTEGNEEFQEKLAKWRRLMEE